MQIYTQSRTYDLSYRLTGIKDALGATKLRDITMGYEGRDNLNSITDLMVAGNSETFTYTPRESLSGAAGPYGALAYTYDGVGNRLTASAGAATDTYSYPGTSNQLSMINLATGGTRGFTYDASGAVTAEARPGGTYGYTYNAAGRMSEFLINGILQASYKYDAMGRQAIRTLTSPTPVTIHSVFDSDGRRIAEYNETSGALIREYVWNGWEPIAVIEGGVISFVRADHIGRPVFATNASGVKTWTATYTPFGGVHTSTGAPPSARFPGQWFQSESGLHQNWMRDYDPTTGRYLQADPLGLVDGASVYGYVGQNPTNYVDPNGEQKTDPWPTTPQAKKDFICGRYRIICETDPHKGNHCSWSKKNDNGRKMNGKKTCVRENGEPCEDSEPPPAEVLECLRERGFCPQDEPLPYSPWSIPAVPPMIIPKMPGGGGGWDPKRAMPVPVL